MASIRITTAGGLETTVVAMNVIDAYALFINGTLTVHQYNQLVNLIDPSAIPLATGDPIDDLASIPGIATGQGAGLPLQTIEPGSDLRDIAGGPAGGPSGGLPAIIGVAALVRLLAPALATRAMPVIRGVAPAGARFGLGTLPSWLQTALVAVGATVGIDLLMDLPGTDLIPAGISIGGNGAGPMHGVHLPHDLMAHIVGSWVANDVVFYRLSDGRLAVQNKRGRWKVWRPKKPIVIMPTGAVDLRTMLRADAVLNKQAKRLAAMLNRRAPRPRRSKTAGNQDSVIVMDGKVVTK